MEETDCVYVLVRLNFQRVAYFFPSLTTYDLSIIISISLYVEENEETHSRQVVDDDDHMRFLTQLQSRMIIRRIHTIHHNLHIRSRLFLHPLPLFRSRPLQLNNIHTRSRMRNIDVEGPNDVDDMVFALLAREPFRNDGFDGGLVEDEFERREVDECGTVAVAVRVAIAIAIGYGNV